MTGRRVLIVDDHPVFRSGLAALFTSAGYDVVGEAAGFAEAIALARTTAPEVVLMDLGLPDGSGVDATARIVGERPGTRVIVVTMFDDEGAVREALDAGAAGYVVKDAMPAEVLAAVAAAVEGAVVLGSGVARSTGRLVPTPAPDPFGLTPRERDVLDLVIRGLGNRQIAERLGLSGKTVANHVSTLLVKCGAIDRVELGRLARAAIADAAPAPAPAPAPGVEASRSGERARSSTGTRQIATGTADLTASSLVACVTHRAEGGWMARPATPIAVRSPAET